MSGANSVDLTDRHGHNSYLSAALILSASQAALSSTASPSSTNDCSAIVATAAYTSVSFLSTAVSGIGDAFVVLVGLALTRAAAVILTYWIVFVLLPGFLFRRVDPLLVAPVCSALPSTTVAVS